MILVATLMSDTKWSTRLTALPAMLKLKGDVRYYINVETWAENLDGSGFRDVMELLRASGRPFDYDIWRRGSSWTERKPADQDQSRLEPICVARNMARACALTRWATHLFFVDSDVVVPEDGLARLLALGEPLAGGLVPGRGAHSKAQYVFHIHKREGNKVWCGHGTLGCCLIERRLFETIPFRYGPHPTDRKANWMSEDPCFAADCEAYAGVKDWVIDLNVRCQHLDDPANPLTETTADNSYRGHE